MNTGRAGGIFPFDWLLCQVPVPAERLVMLAVAALSLLMSCDVSKDKRNVLN